MKVRAQPITVGCAEECIQFTWPASFDGGMDAAWESLFGTFASTPLAKDSLTPTPPSLKSP